MAIKITYFVHGTTVDNENNISSGWDDIGLSELGIKQSKDLKKQINIEEFDAIFCSDLRRAIESAKLIFGENANIILDKRLRECNYGKFNSKPSEIVEPMQEKFIEERFPDGENYEDVKKRVEEFIHFLKKEYDGKSIAIVSHKAPQLAIEVIINKKTWEQAFEEDWRKTKLWQPGWIYMLE